MSADLTPLTGPESPLDERQRAVVTAVAEAEYAKILTLPTDDPLDPKRRYRVEVTRDELVAQPQAIGATWARNEATLPDVAAHIAAGDVERVFLVGAGDSYAVMVAMRQLLETAIGVPCEPVQSLDFAYYQQHLIGARSLVIALSSSGETTRTVEAALVAQHAGAITIALTNTEGSTLARECGHTLLISATRVGWPTQASTAAMALLADLGLRIAAARGQRRDDLERGLREVPALIARVVDEHEAAVAEIAEQTREAGMYLFSAGGPNWASAIIGAAKVRECSPNHAQAIQVEEYHHYNSQKAGEPLWLIAPSGPTIPRARDTARDAIRYQGSLFTVTTEGVEAFEGLGRTLALPAMDEMLSPLVYVVPVQMFGHHVAMAKFRAAERESR